jgi:hypothetical protein
MVKNFDKPLFNLKNESVRVSATNYHANSEQGSAQLLFTNGSKLRADYWRVSKDGKAVISSFDHRQKYGFPAPIDAIAGLRRQLQDKTVADAQLDKETGDLLFQFTDNIKFQVFNFTG